MFFKLESKSWETEVQDVLTALKQVDMQGFDISDDEFAKSHVRRMIGVCRCLMSVYSDLSPLNDQRLSGSFYWASLEWNIIIETTEPDLGKVLAGIQAPPHDCQAFDEFLTKLDFSYVEETSNPIYKRFLCGRSLGASIYLESNELVQSVNVHWVKPENSHGTRASTADFH